MTAPSASKLAIHEATASFSASFDMTDALGARNIKANLDLIARENFFVETGLVQHHALNDAKANRYSLMTDSSNHFRS